MPKTHKPDDRDPSGLTTEQLHREVGLIEAEMTRRLKAAVDVAMAQHSVLREHTDGEVAIVKQRLDGIDKATVVLNDLVTRVPTDVQQEVGHLRELSEEKFRSVSTQFHERDTRSERESKDNKTAVDAAFAASKEASAEQNKSNTLAIDKSEKATTETINKNQILAETSIKALSDKNDDTKERVNRLELRVSSVENQRQGANAERRESRDNSQYMTTTVISVIFALASVATLIVYIVARH